MVHGLKKFKEYFGNYTDHYVFIGGTACEILMDELGFPFRATKDLDMVLLIEVIEVTFGRTFWKFIEDGGYKNRETSLKEHQFYRFTEPTDSSFPKMIELFSKHPCNFELKFESGLTPIHIDDSIVSLSAILLNDLYYDLLVKGKRAVDGYSVIQMETVILFKIKAYLDIKERKENGETFDSKNLKKHKHDVFRLLANVTPTRRVEVGEDIKNDIRQFVELIIDDKPDLKNLGIRSVSFSELVKLLENIFLQVNSSDKLV
jgi:hypothetical protein